VNVTSGEHVNMLSRRKPNVRDINPSVLRWLYRTVAYSPAATNQNELGIVGYNNEHPDPWNLYLFMEKFRADATDATPALEVIDDNYQGQAGRQADLDVEYTLALAYPTPVIYYRGTGNGVQLEPGGKLPGSGDEYLQWLNYMIGRQRIPQTIALGHGTPEPSITSEYATALCDLFAELGLRGTSVLVASEDDGVGQGNCKDVLGNVRFYTSFPASCMYGVCSLLASCRVQVSHQTVVISQVHGSLVSRTSRI
jgi:tripeptidyl-peptidase-1